MRLAAVESLGELQLAVPSLVDGVHGDHPLAREQIAQWLLAVEAQLQTNGIPSVATFATLRGRLWSVERGMRLPGLELSKPGHARKWRALGASAILDEASRTLEALVAPSRAAVQETSAALRQAIELARIREQHGGASLPLHSPVELWNALLFDSDFAPLATRAASLLGKADAQVLLARAIVDQAHSEQDERARAAGAQSELQIERDDRQIERGAAQADA